MGKLEVEFYISDTFLIRFEVMSKIFEVSFKILEVMLKILRLGQKNYLKKSTLGHNLSKKTLKMRHSHLPYNPTPRHTWKNNAKVINNFSHSHHITYLYLMFTPWKEETLLKFFMVFWNCRQKSTPTHGVIH